MDCVFSITQFVSCISIQSNAKYWNEKKNNKIIKSYPWIDIFSYFKPSLTILVNSQYYYAYDTFGSLTILHESLHIAREKYNTHNYFGSMNISHGIHGNHLFRCLSIIHSSLNIENVRPFGPWAYRTKYTAVTSEETYKYIVHLARFWTYCTQITLEMWLLCLWTYCIEYT